VSPRTVTVKHYMETHNFSCILVKFLETQKSDLTENNCNTIITWMVLVKPIVFVIVVLLVTNYFVFLLL